MDCCFPSPYRRAGLVQGIGYNLEENALHARTSATCCIGHMAPSPCVTASAQGLIRDAEIEETLRSGRSDPYCRGLKPADVGCLHNQ